MATADPDYFIPYGEKATSFLAIDCGAKLVAEKSNIGIQLTAKESAVPYANGFIGIGTGVQNGGAISLESGSMLDIGINAPQVVNAWGIMTPGAIDIESGCKVAVDVQASGSLYGIQTGSELNITDSVVDVDVSPAADDGPGADDAVFGMLAGQTTISLAKANQRVHSTAAEGVALASYTEDVADEPVAFSSDYKATNTFLTGRAACITPAASAIGWCGVPYSGYTLNAEAFYDLSDTAKPASEVQVGVVLPQPAPQPETAHNIVLATDRHGNSEAIGEALQGMPKTVEYVSVVGDIVGDGGNRSPEFKTSQVRDEILGVGFEGVTARSDMSIVWADHDAGAIDDARILFADTGKGESADETLSGVMKVGKNADGSTAYYIYGIAFYEMKEQTRAELAAKRFEQWVDTVADNTVPIIVLCHMPLHYARGDNEGAPAWNKALNYAAVGAETEEAGKALKRNVIFAFGHNHTVESKTGESSGEFYVPCGSTMEVGAQEGAWSHIYYTYFTAGYLNQNTTASLVTVDDGTISVSKYDCGEVSDAVYDTESAKSGAFADTFETAGVNQIPRVPRMASKLKNTLTVKGKTVKLKASKLKKKALKVKRAKAITLGKAQGTVRFKLSSVRKAKFKKYFKLAENGKLTVKKGLKKGAYTLKIKVKAAGNAKYKALTKTATVKIKVV